MELKLDLSKRYAIALEGGGARGGYEVGAWKALEEAGVRYDAVSGSSVGALNGALMAMHDLENAERLWKNIRFSQVMNVDDERMERVMKGEVRGLSELRTVLKRAGEIVRDGGFDVEPLRKLLEEVIDEKKVRSSDVNFYIVTYSITDHKELDLDAKALPEGELHDMLLASAYFPAFKHEKLGGKRYTDGGVQDVVPIDSLVSRGYKDLIVIRIYGVGVEKRVKIPKDVSVTTIAPYAELGPVLNFSGEQSAENLKLGYFDAKRVLYGLYGKTYYIDRTLTEDEAYELLAELIKNAEGTCSLRALHEELLPALAHEAGAKGDYYDVFAAFLEKTAAELEIDPFEIITDKALYERVRSERRSKAPQKPSRLLALLPLQVQE